MQFFELSLACPPEIQDCDRHRLNYMNELDTLKKSGGCGGCAERSLRNRYISLLQTCLQK